MAAGEVAPASTFVQAQRNVTIDALKAASGQISGKRGAAEELGLERTTLQHKIRRLRRQKHITGTSRVPFSAIIREVLAD